MNTKIMEALPVRQESVRDEMLSQRIWRGRKSELQVSSVFDEEGSVGLSLLFPFSANQKVEKN